MWSSDTPYAMTWAQFGTLIERIAIQVKAAGFYPDTVCAVARGGLVSAAYIATILDRPDLYVVRVRRTTSDAIYSAKQEPTLQVVTPTPPGARVLVVDDIVGTGVTARLVADHLAALGVRQTRFAALARNATAATFTPDFCPLAVDNWVVFPWEQHDRGQCTRLPALQEAARD